MTGGPTDEGLWGSSSCCALHRQAYDSGGEHSTMQLAQKVSAGSTACSFCEQNEVRWTHALAVAIEHAMRMGYFCHWYRACCPTTVTTANTPRLVLTLRRQAIKQAAQHLPVGKMTLGLPFYARHVRSGDWVSYEDVVQRMAARAAAAATARGGSGLSSSSSSAVDPATDRFEDLFFNGVATIQAKTRLAIDSEVAGAQRWAGGDGGLAGRVDVA
jgi:hypothetical protein